MKLLLALLPPMRTFWLPSSSFSPLSLDLGLEVIGNVKHLKIERRIVAILESSMRRPRFLLEKYTKALLPVTVLDVGGIEETVMINRLDQCNKQVIFVAPLHPRLDIFLIPFNRDRLGTS